MESYSGKGRPVLLGCKNNSAIQNNNEGQNETSVNTVEKSQPRILSQSFKGQNNFINHSQRNAKDSLTVSVQNLCKSYEKEKPILSNLCMQVKKGTIYGLLGSSGCGKTTALSCIVGLKKWDSGQILLFGRRPNGAPGRRVGYMPQDIALYNEISIKETIEYYGRLYGMSEQDVEQQWLWLVDFLQLPAQFKLIKDCSGGQKRRVSLAVTLVHSPDLLILDEPTVGLDPLLRESIWQHLYKMVQTQKTTVIITTHYIEEARCSNTIGVMRKGRLLVEESPETLLLQYECDLLEQVVLNLCRKDLQVLGSNNRNNNITDVIVVDKHSKVEKSGSKIKTSKNSYNVYEQFQENWQLSNQRRSSIRMDKWESKHEGSDSSILQRIRALCTVIWLVFMRHPAFMIMILFLPTLQVILTLAVLGTHPKDLQFGVVNHDTLQYDTCFVTDTNSSEISLLQSNMRCNFQHLSCSLLEEISRTETIKLVPMRSDIMAREQVVKGDLWGYFMVPSNYSSHLEDLVIAKNFAENETLEGSRIHLTMDMSNYLAAVMVLRNAYEAYENFAKKMATSCGLDSREFQLPMMYKEPVFGNTESTFADYVIPIVIVSVIVEVPMLVTSILFITDRRQGTLDRSRVAGVRFKEVMISHVITQSSVIIGQTAICSVVLYLFYDFRVAGYYWLYFLMCILVGLGGEAGGFLIGVVSYEEVEAVVTVMFIGSILLLYEGVLGPIQGMATIARYIAYWSPTTLIIESFRSVIYRGVGFSHDFVWPGIAILVGWAILFWAMSVIIFIRKQR